MISHTIMKKISLLFFVLSLSACQTTDWAVITPEDGFRNIEWSDEELYQEAGKRTVRITSEASYHVILLNESERPHYHDYHDAIVFILSGETFIHLENETFIAVPGDVIEIPRGTLHWAELVDDKPVEVYAVYTPAFDGNDRRFLEREVE